MISIAYNLMQGSSKAVFEEYTTLLECGLPRSGLQAAVASHNSNLCDVVMGLGWSLQ